MGGINDIIDDEEFEETCLEMKQLQALGAKYLGVSPVLFSKWIDLLESDTGLCVQEIVNYMQQPETDRQQCNPCDAAPKQ